MTDGDYPDDEFYDSADRSQGDFGAFFECDADTGYFYFYAIEGKRPKILIAAQIYRGPPDFEQGDISVRWNDAESCVGLFIKNQLWAVFDAETGGCHVGHYRERDQSPIPRKISESFSSKKDKK